MPSLRWLLVCGVLAVLVVLKVHQATHNRYGNSVLDAQARVQIGTRTFHVTVAETVAQQSRGLGGVTHLAQNQGMYFPLSQQQEVSFWMKDMRIPIDIIWIKGGQVAGVDANLAPPLPDTPDDKLAHYQSPVPFPDAVLEIAAGQAQRSGIKVHDPVKFQP